MEPTKVTLKPHISSGQFCCQINLYQTYKTKNNKKKPPKRVLSKQSSRVLELYIWAGGVTVYMQANH